MELPPENSTSCFLAGVGLRAGIGGIAVVICGIVMVLIVCLKAYKTFIDRLVLYITISTFLCSISAVLQVVSLMENKIKDGFDGVCTAVGYLTLLTVCILVLFLVVLSLHLFLLLAFRVKVSKYEKLIVVGIPIISIALAAIPFAIGKYGSSFGWCWIESRGGNKSVTGFVEQMVLGYVPQMVVTAFSLFTAVYVAWVFCRHRGARRQHMEAVKETIHLVLYPIFIELLTFVALAYSIDHYIKDDPYCQSILWWLSTAFFPLIVVVIALALLFHVVVTEYRRRKRKRQSQSTESETRYTVPPEFPSEVDPLVITGARPQEPKTAYNAVFLTDSINIS